MRKSIKFLAILTVLVLISLACSALPFGKENNQANQPANEEPAADEPAAEKPPTEAPTPTQAPTQAPPPESQEAELGEEQRNEEGGFSFETVPGYTVETFFTFSEMAAPDADPETGPMFVLLGGPNEGGDQTLDQVYDSFITDLGEDVELANKREIQVDGKPGYIADVSGEPDGVEVKGHLVVVSVSPQQYFVMVAAATPERWDSELGPLFEPVLQSVAFFEPVVQEYEYEVPIEVTAAPVAPGIEVSQWATYAYASSEYGSDTWSAIQATGAPDTPECGDIGSAWASSGSDTVEWLELYYDTPVIPTEISIFMTYNPNQVVTVEVWDLNGEYHTVYTGDPIQTECPYTLVIPVDTMDVAVNAITVTIDQSILGISWNEIDAVQLVGVTP